MSDTRTRFDATFVCIVLCLGLGPASTDMYLPGLPALALDFDISAATAQLSLTVFMLAFALGHLVFGPVSDHYGRRPVVLTGLALYALASLLCVLAPGFGWLLLGRCGQALGAACCVVIARAIVRDVSGLADSGRLMAYATSGMAIVAACSPSSGGLVVEHFGWQSVFWSLFGLSLTLAILYGFRVPETLPTQRRGQGGFRSQALALKILLRQRDFLGYLLTGGCVYSGMFAFIAVAPYVFVEHFGVSPATFGYLFTTLSLTYFVFSTVAGKVHHRFGSARLIAFGTATACAGGVLMLALALAGADHVVGVLAPQLLCMVGMAFTLAQCYAAAIAPHPTLAGSGAALIGCGQMLMASAVITVIGYFHDDGPRVMALGVCIMTTLSTCAYWLMVRPTLRPGYGAVPGGGDGVIVTGEES